MTTPSTSGDRVVRVASGQGFWGDWLEAPRRQVEGGDVDYLMLDALARHWAGVPLNDAGPPYWLVKKDTVPSDTSKSFPVIVDYAAQYEKLWGVS